MMPSAEHPPGGLLLLQPAFLGDVVLSTALIESWHRAFPQDPIRVWVRKGADSFFDDHPFVTEVLVWDRSGRGKYQRMLSLAFKARRRRPAMVVNLHRFSSMALVAKVIGAPENAGFEGVSSFGLKTKRVEHGIGDGRHETERNHTLIAGRVGPFDSARDRPRLHPSGAHRTAVRSWPAEAAILAPSSVWATKRWPESHWSELVDALHEEDRDVVMMGGPGDDRLLESIVIRCSRRPLVMAGQLSLLGSASLMASPVWSSAMTVLRCTWRVPSVRPWWACSAARPPIWGSGHCPATSSAVVQKMWKCGRRNWPASRVACTARSAARNPTFDAAPDCRCRP